MDKNAEILFQYMRNVIYNLPEAKLDINELDQDFVQLGKGLIYIIECFKEVDDFAKAIGKGELSTALPSTENELASSLKTLHSSLKHLTWQTKQVAQGDYKQRVDYMGEFSDSFNLMICQLDHRQKALEEEIERNRKKTEALEYSNALLIAITKKIRQQIIVIDNKTSKILFLNDAAKKEIQINPMYIDEFTIFIEDNDELSIGESSEFLYRYQNEKRYLEVSSYKVTWKEKNAKAYLLDDISEEKSYLQELEFRAHKDTLTKLNNRYVGMNQLNEWLDDNKAFIICFIDLDNLKYVNDKYGHSAGDRYIQQVSNMIRNITVRTIACRLGGDEFMLLIPDMTEEDAYVQLEEIDQNLQKMHVQGRDRSFSISYGVISVPSDNVCSAGDLLEAADEKMYEHKRKKKIERRAR